MSQTSIETVAYQTYILRIWRSSESKQVGNLRLSLEDVESLHRRGFTSLDELIIALSELIPCDHALNRSPMLQDRCHQDTTVSDQKIRFGKPHDNAQYMDELMHQILNSLSVVMATSGLLRLKDEATSGQLDDWTMRLRDHSRKSAELIYKLRQEIFKLKMGK